MTLGESSRTVAKMLDVAIFNSPLKYKLSSIHTKVYIYLVLMSRKQLIPLLTSQLKNKNVKEQLLPKQKQSNIQKYLLSTEPILR